MKQPSLPTVNDPPERHADWLEWCSLAAPTPSFVSWTSYQRDLTIPGSLDALDPDLEDEKVVGKQNADDLLEEIVNEAGGELRMRAVACGGAVGVYPYQTDRQGVAYRPSTNSLTYRFLLLLSLFGKDAGPKGSHPERSFEELCSLALKQYLGGVRTSLSSVVFGFPRSVLPKHFPDAVDKLCEKLGEGRGSAGRTPERDQKDAKLDLVAWRAFPDGRRGKLVGFGQCATGDDWSDKAFELRPAKWCNLWMRDSATLDPFASLFIPHRPGEDKWLTACTYGGILFDRCRIAWLVPTPTGELGEKIKRWAEHVEKNHRRP